MGWAGYGSRQAASEKCPWSVTTLCSFFSLSLSLSLFFGLVQHLVRCPHQVAARGFGTNEPHVWRAFSFFFLPSFLPSYPPTLLPSFIPSTLRLPSSISQLATGKQGKSNSCGALPGIVIYTCHGVARPVPRVADIWHFTPLPCRDQKFENRVFPLYLCTRIVLINTNLLGSTKMRRTIYIINFQYIKILKRCQLSIEL